MNKPSTSENQGGKTRYREPHGRHKATDTPFLALWDQLPQHGLKGLREVICDK